jgi:chemotaxis protein MotB
VTRFLADSGIPPERMIATGYGKAYPQASNATPEGRQQNRRVEIVILGSGLQAKQRVRAKQ